jgi:hypothetical protein
MATSTVVALAANTAAVAVRAVDNGYSPSQISMVNNATLAANSIAVVGMAATAMWSHSKEIQAQTDAAEAAARAA